MDSLTGDGGIRMVVWNAHIVHEVEKGEECDFENIITKYV